MYHLATVRHLLQVLRDSPARELRHLQATGPGQTAAVREGDRGEEQADPRDRGREHAGRAEEAARSVGGHWTWERLEIRSTRASASGETSQLMEALSCVRVCVLLPAGPANRPLVVQESLDSAPEPGGRPRQDKGRVLLRGPRRGARDVGDDLGQGEGEGFHSPAASLGQEAAITAR